VFRHEADEFPDSVDAEGQLMGGTLLACLRYRTLNRVDREFVWIVGEGPVQSAGDSNISEDVYTHLGKSCLLVQIYVHG